MEYISYLLIMRAHITKPAAEGASRFTRLFGERIGIPDDAAQWIESIDANPWPIYRDMVMHSSLYGRGRFFAPDQSIPPYAGVHGLSAEEVNEFRRRWPEWFIEAVPMLDTESLVELAADVNPYPDEDEE